MSQFDDPVAAALAEIAREQEEDLGILGPITPYKRSSVLLVRGLLASAAAGSPLPLASAIKKLPATWLDERTSRTHEQQVYVVDAVIEKLRIHDAELIKIRNDAGQAKEFEHRFSDIVDDTLAVSATRASNEKLDYFAAIAVSGALVYRSDPVEQTQEFLRITSQLTATDIFVLRETEKSQGALKQWPGQMESWLHDIQIGWKPLLESLKGHGISEMNYRSAFVRLQALGLVERMQPNMSTNAPTDVPYALLELGKLYLSYLTG